MAEVSETIIQDGSVGAQKSIFFDTLGAGTIWGSNSDITDLGVNSVTLFFSQAALQQLARGSWGSSIGTLIKT